MEKQSAEDSSTPAKKQLLMREEVLDDGAPLAFAELMNARGVHSTIHHAAIKEVWSGTVQALRKAIQQQLPNIEIVAPKLWEGERAKKELLRELGGIPVSLDSYDTNDAFALCVSRHFSPGGRKQITVGNRPGSAPLSQQIQNLKSYVGNKPIVLLEDDMFTGGTAKVVIAQLQAAGINIQQFVVGLQVSEIATIQGVPIVALEQYNPDTVLDVVDWRDFLFGLKDAGLAIKDKGRLYRAPYVNPWVNLTARASIPLAQAENLSKDIISINRAMYRQLQKVTAHKYLVRDMHKPFQDFAEAQLPELSEASMDEFCVEATVISK